MHIFLCFLLQLVFNYVNMNTTKQKAVAPTKNEPPPIKKKGKPIISHSAKRYKTMRKDFFENLKAERTSYKEMIDFCCDNLIMNNDIIKELSAKRFLF